MANQSIGSPRFYLDFTQLARLKGFYHWEEGVANIQGLNDDSYSESNNDVWNFDFYKPTSFQLNDTEAQIWWFNFFPEDSIDKSWSRLVSNCNWCGAFNHNITNLTNESSLLIFYNDTPMQFLSGMTTEIVNSGLISNNGYSIMEFSENSQEDLYRIGIGLDSSVEGNVSIATMSFGRYYDMPNSPDLSITKSIQYEGVKIQRTLGGSDYVQINNSGTPNWISGEPFALVHPDESSSRFGRHGRRNWQLKFSYISNDDLFFDLNRPNVFGDLINDQGSDSNEISAGSEIQQIFDLTLGGALSFVFTPDKDATNPEFAQCRLDQESLQATQVAYQTWDVSMNIVEIW